MPDLNRTTVGDDVSRARSGDRAAFGRVMDAHLSLAYRLAIRFLGSTEEAKDVCQDAFVRVWEHFETYDPSRPFAGWLTTIVSRLCLDRLRRRARSPYRWFAGDGTDSREPGSPDPDPEQQTTWKDLASVVLRLLRRLPPTQRVVFALRDLEDLEVEEVATITGLSTGSVKTNLSYARRTIRTILMEEYRVEEARL